MKNMNLIKMRSLIKEQLQNQIRDLFLIYVNINNMFCFINKWQTRNLNCGKTEFPNIALESRLQKTNVLKCNQRQN